MDRQTRGVVVLSAGLFLGALGTAAVAQASPDSDSTQQRSTHSSRPAAKTNAHAGPVRTARPAQAEAPPRRERGAARAAALPAAGKPVRLTVPAAATLAPEARRGRVVGTVMTGLFLGVLLSRVASGAIAARFGWPAVFWTAAVVVALFAVAAWRGLPSIAPSTRLGYFALLRSLGSLWAAHPAMRRAAIAQALLSVAFSAFWSTLAVMLHDQFGLGSAVAGAFGLAGAVGAMAASLAGRWADRRGPAWVTRLGAGLATGCFALLALDAALPSVPLRLGLLVIGTLGFDFGIQAALVGHQTLMYGLDPAARSRLNALLLTSMFIGMAAGSALASALLAQFGWLGVVGLTTAASGGALALRMGRDA